MTSLKVATTQCHSLTPSTMTLVNFSGCQSKILVYNDTCKKCTNDAVKTKRFRSLMIDTFDTTWCQQHNNHPEKQLIVASHKIIFCRSTKAIACPSTLRLFRKFFTSSPSLHRTLPLPPSSSSKFLVLASLGPHPTYLVVPWFSYGLSLSAVVSSTHRPRRWTHLPPHRSAPPLATHIDRRALRDHSHGYGSTSLRPADCERSWSSLGTTRSSRSTGAPERRRSSSTYNAPTYRSSRHIQHSIANPLVASSPPNERPTLHTCSARPTQKQPYRDSPGDQLTRTPGDCLPPPAAPTAEHTYQKTYPYPLLHPIRAITTTCPGTAKVVVLYAPRYRTLTVPGMMAHENPMTTPRHKGLLFSPVFSQNMYSRNFPCVHIPQ